MYHWIDSWLTWQMYVAFGVGLLLGMGWSYILWRQNK